MIQFNFPFVWLNKFPHSSANAQTKDFSEKIMLIIAYYS